VVHYMAHESHPPFSITSPEGDVDGEGGLEGSGSSSRYNAWKGLMSAKRRGGGTIVSFALGSPDLAALCMHVCAGVWWLSSFDRAQARGGVGGTIVRWAACWRVAAAAHVVSSPSGPCNISPVLAVAVEGGLLHAGELEGGTNGNGDVMGLATSSRGHVGGGRGGGVFHPSARVLVFRLLTM
jgi:hypothetical protein